MGRPQKTEFDFLDAKLAFAVGIGLTVEAACEFVGHSRQNYYHRQDRAGDKYREMREFAGALAEKVVSHKIAKAKLASSAADRIISRLDRSLAVMDRILTHAETLGKEDKTLDPKEFNQLVETVKHVTKTVMAYAASKAPNRLTVEGNVVHGHVLMHDDSVDAIASFEEHMKSRFLPPPLEVIDVEPVPAT